MSYHWFKKMLPSTSMLTLGSSSSSGLATHIAEAKDNLNGEKSTTNLNHNVTSPSVNGETNNNGAGTPHESNQAGNEGTGSNSRDANPDSSNVKPDSNNQNPDPDSKPDPNSPNPGLNLKPDPDKSKPNLEPKPDPDKPKPSPDPKPDPDKSKPNLDPKPDLNKPNPNPSPNPNQPGGSNQFSGSKNGGTWNPNASDGSNQGQWQPNGNQGNSQNPTSNDFISQRFSVLVNGAHKYNPYILNQIDQLGKKYGEATDEDIYSIIRKQNFSGNAYLNGPQQQSNYLRFQYFNPLKSERYYRSLDEQVLALITDEIGSMPDLKKPEDKPDPKQRSFEPHEKDDFTVAKKQKDNRKSASTVHSRSWLAIICSTMVVFSIMLFLFVKRNKKKDKNES